MEAALLINRNSLVGRFYDYWEKVDGYYPYTENLCHVGRVVLFWVPWNWFWRQPVVGPVRPWMVGVPPVVTVGIILAIFHLWEAVLQALLFIAAAALSLATVAAILIGTFWVNDKLVVTWRLGHRWRRSTARRVWTWFWGKRLISYVCPWMVLEALVATYTYFAWPRGVWLFLVVMLLTAVLIGLVVMIADDAIKGKPIPRVLPTTWNYVLVPTGKTTAKAARPVLGTIATIALWLWAQKKRICPPVEFTDETETEEEE